MSFVTIFLSLLLIHSCKGLGGPKGTYSNLWLMKTQSNQNAVKSAVRGNGFKLVAEPFPGFYILEQDGAPYSSKSAGMTAELSAMKNTLKNANLKQLMFYNHFIRAVSNRAVSRTSFNISDNQWSDMWHVESSQFPSMGVYNSWLKGYSGLGIHVGVLDDGIEPTHVDLLENYDENNSFDYLADSSFVNHTELESHGTNCAGLISATKNDDCVLGTAYHSTFSAVKIFDNYFSLNDLGESYALNHKLESTDIYSNSWGPSDSGSIVSGPGELGQEALRKAVVEGRNGKGAIYTWAAGNGGLYDDCNCDGYVNSIYTIGVTSVGRDQAPSYYSEECTSILAGTYSGDFPDLTIATTTVGDGCTTGFQGTSASCPIAAGIIALVLEANPELTWRDVQYLIVETSETDGLISADWQINGAGKRVSHSFGFGLMNAENMIDRATVWTNVPEQVMCSSPMIAVDETSENGVYITSEYISDGCSGTLRSLEHVQVWMSFKSTYRGRIMIKLYSPQGTVSRLLRARRYDNYNGNLEWTFMTLLSWGENPTGTWTLQMETADSSIVYTLNSWQLILYGTQTRISSTGAQIAQEQATEDSDNVGAIVGGVVGGTVLFVMVAVGIYIILKIKKPKDPTVYPTLASMPANTAMGTPNLGIQNDGYTA